MNTLTITASVPFLSSLTLVGTNTYAFVVKFFNSSGSPLGNPNIPNTYSTTVTTTSPTFNVNVPITDGIYSIPNVTIKLYSGSDSNCCFASTVASINNSGSGESYDGTITEIVNGRTYKYINDRDMQVDVLSNGNVRLLYNEISTSGTGKEVKGWLMNGQYGGIPDAEKNALRSTEGLAFPNRRIDAHYMIYYAATDTASTFSELGSKDYFLFSNDHKNNNSKNMMYVMLSITKNEDI